MKDEMMKDPVQYSLDDDGICTLVLDLPGSKMNVLGERLSSGFEAALKRAFADEVVKGIVVTSGKDTFVAGGDLNTIGDSAMTKGKSLGVLAEESSLLSRLLRWMETAGKPIACAVNGLALGGGFEIALASHYRVVSDDPRLVLGLPESQVGLMPGGGGTQRLPRLAGVTAGLPLILEGKNISAQEALKLNLVHEVVPVADLINAAKRWLLTVGDAVQPWDKKGFRAPGGSSSLDMEFRNIFSGSNSILRAKTYGNYPAPNLICSAVYEGMALPMDKALRIEAMYFARLLADPVGGNLVRTMFINKGKADGLASRPEGIEKFRFARIGVVGAGTMGAGIAFSAARAGIEVILIDRDMAAAERGKAYSAKKLARDLEKGRTTQAKMDQLLARIHPRDSYDDLRDVMLTVETVFEDREVKRDVIGRIDAAMPAEGFIASNTSALPISSLAEYSSRPERFIGLHFFSPVERMQLVEIIRGAKSGDMVWAAALDFVQAIRKTPITVNDQPGFFTTRFIGSFVESSMDMLQEGVSPALIENGALMVGMPMGALAISDSIGLDVGHKASQAHAKEKGEAPKSDLLEKMVEGQGRHGIKNGKGFYDYAADGKRLWRGLSDLLPQLAEQPDIKEAKARILYAQLAEGMRCFADGVLIDVIDGDLGATLGVGFPAYLGGPYAAMDTLGLPAVIAECDRLHGLYGKMFAVPDLIREMAVKGQTFHGVQAAPSPGARRA